MITKHTQQRKSTITKLSTDQAKEIGKAIQASLEQKFDGKMDEIKAMCHKANIVATIWRLENESIPVTKENIIEDLAESKGGGDSMKKIATESVEEHLPTLQEEGMVKADLTLTAQGRVVGKDYNQTLDKDTEFDEPDFTPPEQKMKDEQDKGLAQMPIPWLLAKMSEYNTKHGHILELIKRAGKVSQISDEYTAARARPDDVHAQLAFVFTLFPFAAASAWDLFDDGSQESIQFFAAYEDTFGVSKTAMTELAKSAKADMDKAIQRQEELRKVIKEQNYLVRSLDGASYPDFRLEIGYEGVLLKGSYVDMGDEEGVSVIWLKDEQQKPRQVFLSVLEPVEPTDKFEGVEGNTIFEQKNALALMEGFNTLSPLVHSELNNLINKCTAGVPFTPAEKLRFATLMQQVHTHLEACGVETSAINDWQAHTERSLEFHSKNAEMLKKRWSEEPGRNDPCPCGSGKKFKKCHGGK